MCVLKDKGSPFLGGGGDMSLFSCTCVVALWTISLKSCLSTYLLVDVLCINFNKVEGLSLFLLLVWGVVSKKFSKFVWFDLATTKF